MKKRSLLRKDVTKTFFIAEDGYIQLEKRWKEMINSSERQKLNAEHNFLYQALRGKDNKQKLFSSWKAQTSQ